MTSLTATSGFQKEMIELIDLLALSATGRKRGGEKEGSRDSVGVR